MLRSLSCISGGGAFLARSLSVSILVLAGCSSGPPPADVTVTEMPQSAIVSSQTQVLTPEELSRVSDVSMDGPYVLGPSDVISTQIYQNPDISVPPAGAGAATGALVTGDGSVRLPLVGSIQVGGLTLDQAQQVITQAYAKYITNPNVNIQLVQAQSLHYTLLGAFTLPGVKYPERPLSLLEALGLGGSVDFATADLYQAYIANGSTKLPVDLHALLVGGDLSQNITLASNDVIVVPAASSENAYVFGAVTKPGPVPFGSGQLSLLAGLSAAGMDLPSYTAARLSNIHIIRSVGTTGQFIVVNAAAILQGKAAPFLLQPGDIVFVPPTGVATWNQVLGQILPSLQTIAGVLQPFVSIKYLTCHGGNGC